MNAQVWIALVAAIVLPIIQMANLWALEWYKQKASRTPKATPGTKKRNDSKSIRILQVVTVWMALFAVVASVILLKEVFKKPFPNPISNAVVVSIAISQIFYTLAVALIVRAIRVSEYITERRVIQMRNELLKLMLQGPEAVEKYVDSILAKRDRLDGKAGGKPKNK
jgi:hypothetical protein